MAKFDEKALKEFINNKLHPPARVEEAGIGDLLASTDKFRSFRDSFLKGRGNGNTESTETT